jgi:hypothetical protein
MARRANLRRNPRKRYQLDPSQNETAGNVAVSSAAVVAGQAKVVVGFNGPVLYPQNNGLPTGWLFGGAAPTSVIAKGVQSITLGVTGTLTAGTAYSISSNDPAVRSSVGGYVLSTAGSLS